MSELLPNLNDNEIKILFTNLVQTALDTNQSPKEIDLTDYTIIFTSTDCSDSGTCLQLYTKDKIEFTYKMNTDGNLCFANITTPEKILKYKNITYSI